jgi:P-aminobenzoate N-oxygenase AurF
MNKAFNPFTTWRDRASVRTGAPARQSAIPDGNWFSVSELPIISHPQVAELGEAAAQNLMARKGRRFLSFTETLENHLVLPVCMYLAEARSPYDFGRDIEEGAGTVCTDEVHHANRARVLRKNLDLYLNRGARAIQPVPYVKLNRDRLESGSYEGMLWALGSVIVCETVITQTLRDVCNDPSLDSEMRNVITEHADDEAVHNTFFGGYVLGRLATILTSEEMSFLAGVVIPTCISEYMSKDHAEEVLDLEDLGLSRDVAFQIVDQAYPKALLEDCIRRGAKSTIRHMNKIGLLRHPGVISGLQKYSLIDSVNH